MRLANKQGVEERSRKDQASLAAEKAERSGALERKAVLYSKIARGEVEASGSAAELVDFGAKGRVVSAAVSPAPAPAPHAPSAPKKGSAKIAALREKLRRAKGGG